MIRAASRRYLTRPCEEIITSSLRARTVSSYRVYGASCAYSRSQHRLAGWLREGERETEREGERDRGQERETEREGGRERQRAGESRQGEEARGRKENCRVEEREQERRAERERERVSVCVCVCRSEKRAWCGMGVPMGSH